MPIDVVIESLSVAKHWCIYNKGGFFANETFTNTLLNMLYNFENIEQIKIFCKLINIFRKMLSNNKFSKLLLNMRF